MEADAKEMLLHRIGHGMHRNGLEVPEVNETSMASACEEECKETN